LIDNLIDAFQRGELTSERIQPLIELIFDNDGETPVLSKSFSKEEASQWVSLISNMSQTVGENQ
jgi:hypothetical protein